MKIINQNKLQFNGYKNVIHNNLKTDSMQILFMSMQLNNDNNKDLDEFKNICRLYGKDADSDVLNVIFSKFVGRDEFLFLDDISMYTGEELKKQYDLYGYTEAYKMEEKASLKAYTLLASITKRMMNNGLCQTDSDLKKVVVSSIESFVRSLGADSSKIFNLIQHSVIENKQIEKTAEEFNNIIVKNMSKFFK